MESEVLQNRREVGAEESTVRVINVPGVIFQHKRLVTQVTAAAAVVAVAVAFLWPARYIATTRILPPQQDQSLAGAMMSQLGALGSIAGIAQGTGMGIRNPNDMYVGMLKSRTLQDALVQRFDLMNVYGAKRMSDARRELENNSEILNGKEGFISISVDDRSPKRAADLANGYVEQLKKLTRTLAITEAGQRRLFFDERLEEARKALADSEEGLKKTQQTTGIIQLDSQSSAIIESAVRLRAEIATKEVQLHAMRSFATDSNPDLRLLEQELAGLRSQLVNMTKRGGGDGDLQIATGKIPDAGLEYLRKLRDFKYHEAVFELLAKQAEIARLDEAKAGAVIQVLDSAIEPDIRSSPKRGVIIVVGTILGFLFTAAALVVREVRAI